MKKRKKQKIPAFFLVAGGILITLASIMLILQSSNGEPTTFGGHEEIFAEIERVSLEDAKTALDTGTAVFVDVRSAEAYAASHVAGSISVPLGEIESRLSELDEDEWII